MTPGTWLVVWDIIIGIWDAWFVALVVIGITQRVWQSRDKWRSQARYWWRSRIWQVMRDVADRDRVSEIRNTPVPAQTRAAH
jgi:hypothetical protein